MNPLDEEEGEKVKIAQAPVRPSEEEVREHEVTHWPYRAWCRHCVRGRGRGRQRRARSQARDKPIVSIDYTFIGDNKASESPVLVAHDSCTGAVFAYPVRRKGADDEVIRQLLHDIEFLGHREIVFKGDQEPAAQAVQRSIAERMPTVALENSPVHDPQANGAIENAIQRVVGLTRVHKSQLEERLEHEIPANWAIMSWLVGFAAMVLTRYARNDEGRTPLEHIKGKRKPRDIPNFAERVLYLDPNRDGKAKLDMKWKVGFFVGVVGRTDEVMIINDNRVVKAWTFRRLPEEDQWDLVQKDGYSAGCPGCRSIRLGSRQQGHSEACRQRILDHLSRDAEGALRIKKFKDKAEEHEDKEKNVGTDERDMEQDEEEEEPDKKMDDTPDQKSPSSSSSSSSS